jgi:hypothetical protein
MNQMRNGVNRLSRDPRYGADVRPPNSGGRDVSAAVLAEPRRALSLPKAAALNTLDNFVDIISGLGVA